MSDGSVLGIMSYLWVVAYSFYKSLYEKPLRRRRIHETDSRPPNEIIGIANTAL